MLFELGRSDTRIIVELYGSSLMMEERKMLDDIYIQFQVDSGVGHVNLTEKLKKASIR